MRNSLLRKNLLPEEQILSFQGDAHYDRTGENGNGGVAAVESVLIYINQGLFQMPLNCGQIADSVDHDHTAMAALRNGSALITQITDYPDFIR